MDSPAALAQFYRATLLDDVIPFWLRHGMDSEHGGILTALDRDGSLLDSDKSIWFQGRAAWMFGTLYRTIEPREEWLSAARSCIDFLRRHAEAPDGKLYFTVTREGLPLRMRRYVYSESFAAIANAVYARIASDNRAASDAVRFFETYLQYSFTPGVMPPKSEPDTRPSKGIGPLMIGLATAQEIRENLGDCAISGATCTEWIDRWIEEISRDFLKPHLQVLLETVSPDGAILDHFDGRIINPGHAIEAAWFIMHEGKIRSKKEYVQLGLTILDWMWQRGWDPDHGGLFYFRDIRGLPVQEYWHDMKFWWPHNEAIIATLLAWRLSDSELWRERHRLVHDWSFLHFPDLKHGEWYGYLHRDGTPSVRLKGNMWKGPFHLPRMLWYCTLLLEE
ncbi:AGE family epimerase/isomerase [soil metagenome]